MSADATLWSSEAWASAPDAYLLKLTREGSAEAFGELWRRHLPAAYAVAGRHRGRSAPEDVVAEAAARVLALIRDGRGPDEHFRAYFLSAVRTVAIDQGRRDLRVVPTEADDLDELAEPHEDPFALIAVENEGAALVREAFAGLSERDQRVLWHTTVEGAAPRTVAPALGMTANAVSVRAMRARESLRALYLDALAQRGLAGADSDECRWTVSHLGALVRGRLPRRQTERAEAHVAGCPHAAAIADDLRQCHDTFPALLVPLVLAAGLATPGFVSVAALAGLSGAAGAAPTSSASSASGASGAGAVADIASQVTALVAGLAVTAGVAGALALPSSSFTPPSAAPAPKTSSASPAAPGSSSPDALASSGSPRVPAGSTGRPGETTSASVVPPAVGLTGTPSATRAPASDVPTSLAAATTAQRDATTSAPGGGTRVGGGAADATSPSRPPAPPAPPVPTSTSPSEPPPAPSPTPTPPSTTPPAPQPGGSAPTVTARLVSAGDPARISVRVRSQVAGSLTIRISNESGSGELSVRNSSWSCTQAGVWSVRCSGGRGQALLDQAGTGGVEPVVVRVTDGTGRTWTETLRPT